MAQPVKSLLSGTPELRPLLARAQTLAALQHQIAAVMPPYLAQTCQVLGLQNGTLSLAVGNATVAAKLRQLAPELAVLLQNRGCEVSGIRVKVQVAYAAELPRSAPRKLGRPAQRALLELSQHLDDSPLKHALEKMLQEKI